MKVPYWIDESSASELGVVIRSQSEAHALRAISLRREGYEAGMFMRRVPQQPNVDGAIRCGQLVLLSRRVYTVHAMSTWRRLMRFILAEGAIALPVTLSGGALFAS